MTPLHATLDEARRERLFALMREFDARSDALMVKGREDAYSIPVGAALFDYTLEGAAYLELVTALRRAPSLEAAQEQASNALRLWVTKHNARRKDINWQRWGESGQDKLHYLLTRVRDALA